MQILETISRKITREFLPFDLCRLLRTAFNPMRGENVCILIDLENPNDMIDFAFLQNMDLFIQRKAYTYFYRELRNGVMQHLGLGKCDFFAYKTPHFLSFMSPETAVAPDGTLLTLEKDLYPIYDLILCITTHSSENFLKAAAKKHGFRGANLHQLNYITLKTGLSLDYHEVENATEQLRKELSYVDSVSIDFEIDSLHYHLHIDLAAQQAQKNAGICHKAPHIVSLPAGEIYYFPRNVTGSFPLQFAEGTLAIVQIDQNRAHTIILIRGDQNLVDNWQKKIKRNPSLGKILKLGFGTQMLPFSWSPLQDKSIFGSFHLSLEKDEILFSPQKTPDIIVKQLCIRRNAVREKLLEKYEPTPYFRSLFSIPSSSPNRN